MAIAWDRSDSFLHAALGQVRYELGHIDEAEEFFRKALDHDYSNKRALKGLGLVLQEQDKLIDAMYFYLRYLGIQPEDGWVNQNLAAVFHNLGQYERALEYYDRTAKVDPDDSDMLKNRVLTLMALGRHGEAQEILMKAQGLAPGDGEIDALLGNVAAGTGDIATSLGSFETAFQKEYMDPEAHLQYSILAAEKGNIAQAVDHAELAVREFKSLDDFDGELRASWQLGWAYYLNGDYANSVVASSKALDLSSPPASPPAPVYFNRGLAKLRLGNVEEASQDYEAGIEYLSDVTDLAYHGIDDLKEALNQNSDLDGGEKILARLTARYNTLSRQYSPLVQEGQSS